MSVPRIESLEDLVRLEQSCLEDGLLARAFGAKLRITKKGQKVVKLPAVADEEVASALEEALREPWLERRAALVSVLLLARMRS
jgi:hypothetical protein